MITKTETSRSFGAVCKAVDGTDGGEFTAVVSVFGNVDLGGDVVVAGAFTDSLAAWAASGDPIPVIFDHQWHDLDSHIGVVVEAVELAPGDDRLTDGVNKDLGGLWVRCQLDSDGKAVKVRRLLKGGRIREFSFVADILDATWETLDGREVYVLKKLALREVGPTLAGMNPLTSLTSIKSQMTPNLTQDLVSSESKASAADLEPHPPHVGHPGSVQRASARLRLLDIE